MEPNSPRLLDLRAPGPGPVTITLHRGVGSCWNLFAMPEPVSFAEFFATWAPRAREEFLAAHPDPHLVMPKVEVTASAEDAGTDRVDPARTIAHWDLQLLVRVRSRDGRPGRITVGRGAGNDVVIPDRRVSKAQAWFERRDGEWVVGDAGSTNGTRVDAVPVPRTHGVVVRSGARIRLAEALDLMFVEGEALWRIVERVRTATEALSARRP